MTDTSENHLPDQPMHSVQRLYNAAGHMRALADDFIGHVESDQYGGGIEAMKLSELATFYFELKQAYDALDAERKRIYKVVDELSKFRIPERLEREGIDKIQVPEIERSFYVLTKYSASMVDKESAMEWLRDRGDEALIQETVNASTLASYLKDLLIEEGIDPPEELFKFSTYNTTGMSKYKPK